MVATGQLDQAALERLYVELEKPVYNVVYRWLWDVGDAQEVVQEAFLRLWHMRARVDLATVKPLVYRIALNLASTRRRNKRLWAWVPFVDLASSHNGVDDELGAYQCRAEVREAVDSLPEELRRVVMLCAFSEMSYAQVAEVLDIPSGTVGSRKNRAVAMLKEKLERRGVHG
ncbi:MAG: RNA polymerase sigma factor [Proteobacteria bacterium]|jgi:RNA polymerase sigma-70 factor, ECF subfamily|nr:RNA polymerase sigma factor [Pseudomonadota bacterium]